MKQENINNKVLDDLDKRIDNWNKLEGVPERVDELDESRLILKNEIVNGDFSNGTQGWGLHVASQPTTTNNELSFIATSQYGRAVQTIPYTGPDLMYMCGMVKQHRIKLVLLMG